MKIETEESIQQSALVWFTNNYGLKHHNPRLLFYSVANEIGASVAYSIGKSKSITDTLSRVMAKFKLTGFKKGVADVHLCFPNGKLVYIEFKTATGVQRPEQKEFQQQVEALCFKYYIVRSLEEFKEIVNNEL